MKWLAFKDTCSSVSQWLKISSCCTKYYNSIFGDDGVANKIVCFFTRRAEFSQHSHDDGSPLRSLRNREANEWRRHLTTIKFTFGTIVDHVCVSVGNFMMRQKCVRRCVPAAHVWREIYLFRQNDNGTMNRCQWHYKYIVCNGLWQNNDFIVKSSI